eukprot:364812-Chlamydomonas_euryale.AAC.1
MPHPVSTHNVRTVSCGPARLVPFSLPTSSPDAPTLSPHNAPTRCPHTTPPRSQRTECPDGMSRCTAPTQPPPCLDVMHRAHTKQPPCLDVMQSTTTRYCLRGSSRRPTAQTAPH